MHSAWCTFQLGKLQPWLWGYLVTTWLSLPAPKPGSLLLAPLLLVACSFGWQLWLMCADSQGTREGGTKACPGHVAVCRRRFWGLQGAARCQRWAVQVCTRSSAWEPGCMEAPGQGQAADGGWVVLSAHTPRHPGTCPEVRSPAGTKAVPGRLGQLGGGRVYRPTHQLSHGAQPTGPRPTILAPL